MRKDPDETYSLKEKLAVAAVLLLPPLLLRRLLLLLLLPPRSLRHPRAWPAPA